MAIRHISDEKDGAPLTDTDEFAIDRVSTSPATTWSITAAELKTYVAGSGLVNSITGTTTVLANGNSGTPQTGAVTLTFSNSYPGQSSITTLGTISSGVWNGTTIATANGGTGQTTYTDGQLLIGNSSTGSLNVNTLTAGANITLTFGHGTCTIAASTVSSSFATNDYFTYTYFGGL